MEISATGHSITRWTINSERKEMVALLILAVVIAILNQWFYRHPKYNDWRYLRSLLRGKEND